VNAAGTTRTGRTALLEQFAADGLCHMFGNPGTVEQGFLDALEDHPELTYVLALQETVAVGVADGYARATGRPALVQLHSGVGLGNGVGMLYQALRGHAPLVVVAGEAGVAYEAMDAQMACDLVAVARPVTKWATRVTHPGSLLRVLRRAVKVAATPPCGPVFVALPMDVLDAPNDEPVLPTVVPDTRVVPAPALLARAAALLAAGRRPVVLAGDGVAASGAQDELVAVAEALGADVYLVDSSEPNMPAGHPLHRGGLGHMFGTASAAAVADADAVLVVGTYLFPEVFPSLRSPFAPGARVVHVDLDPSAIAKNHPVDLGLVADPRLTLAALVPALAAAATPADAERARARRAARAEAAPAPSTADDDTVLAAFLRRLAARTGGEALVFDEALTASPLVARHLPPVRPGSQLLTRGGSLGVGLPGAIGMKLAHPEREVVGFTGDGGAMYTYQALWTAVRHGVAARLVVCNNHRYRLLEDNIDRYWRDRGDVDPARRAHPSSFDLSHPAIDFAGLARALGADGTTVRSADQVDAAVDAMLAAPGPFVVDLATDDLSRP
jgi:benzoylformate decarboxylase